MRRGLLGAKLGHSYSKMIHEELGGYPYDLIELDEEQLDLFLRKQEFDALNVTIPYKKTVIPYLNQIDEKAKQIGAVNTIVCRDKKLIGTNTDYYGFYFMLQQAKIEVTDKKVIVLGNGGAAQAVIAVLKQLKAKEIILVKRNPSSETISYEACYQDHCDAQVIVNTSPVGMFPHLQECPIDLDMLPHLESVADIIYNPLRTRLIVLALEKGCKTAQGLTMLVGQAAQAIELFSQQSVSLTRIKQMTKKIIQEKRNLVLIGMPSCGKSTLAKRLSNMLDRPMVDSDDEIVKKAGMSIRELFDTQGEQAFRKIEKEVIDELSQRTGLIIATGGGVVKNLENCRSLRQNGFVVFVDRNPNYLLVDPNRPLSKDRETILAMYSERYLLYRQAADVVVKNNGSLNKTLARIAQLWKN